MRERIWDCILALLIVVEIILVGKFYLEDRRATESVWTGSYPMANRNIEWTGAGYQKIYVGSELN